ncbi:MAG: protein kinase [Roseiflexus castenholzii]|uniref:serine/threonine-protein kinase n=1 Tax=Roseiflexus castenholzii TaxID=120962 RepID=UPI000CB8AF43|nr:MAG: protein kinase [Roseiflexus castenholzii]
MALIKKPGTTKGIDLNSSSSGAGADPQGTTTPGAGARAAAPVMQPGVILQGRYVIEGTLGIGGMSVVYRGRDLRFKDVVRPCAIKEMYQSAPDSNTRLLNLKNFEREAGLLATLQHPAIPKVFDFFEENGRVYLILELIQGKDLETVIEEAKGPLPEERVARWAVQLCEVLSYLHNQQPEPIVFRDMKPSNVMVTSDDRIVLIDFGIARSLVRTRGTVIGTEGYSPPEQYKGIAEPQSDLYALGATLHHLLTASDPRTETPFTFHERPLRQLNPQISPEFAAVVEKALSYDMKTRWASADEMRLALLQTPTLRSGQSGGTVAAKVAPRLSNAATTELVWRFVCEDEVRSSPCLSNGMVFVGCYDTNLYAIDAGRGEFRWKYATEGGISSSPAVWNDIVIVGSEDGAVYACEIRRGALRWTFRTSKPVRASPRVLERVIFIGSDDQHFYAIDGMRGAQIWKYRTWMPIRSSACIAGESVYFGGGDGFVYALNIKNGGVRWKQRTQQPVISSPAFAENMVIVGSMDHMLYALDSEGGWPVWKYRTNHYVNSSPFVFGTRVFVGSVDGNLYAIELKNGKLAWKYDTGSQITSSPRVEQGRVYFGAADGCVYCLDAANGSLIWRYETQGPVVSSPAIGEGVVYIGSLDHALYALRA